MRVLVVEQDPLLASSLLRCFRDESYAADHAKDGQEAEWLAFENPYDLITLDLILPVKDGMSVLKNLRLSGIKCPILILTSKTGVQHIVGALDAGADEYLLKPIHLIELTARVRALLRRRENFAPVVLDLGPLVLDSSRREVFLSGKKVDFTAKEYSLLEYFVHNAGQVLTRTQLSEHVWDAHFEANSNIIDVYVGYLRTKMRAASPRCLIKTVRGCGYLLDL
ncbi:MAG: response regulator transcription factor [Oligoflexales bacterium]|nr:response regulator transcription factor [Oligoflexales bacterium]